MSTVLAAIERLARVHPDDAAVIHGGMTLTFRDVVEDARQISDALRRSGVAPGNVVAVHMDRGPRMIAALLAIWKTRCAYTILDKLLPAARRAFIYSDAAVRSVLTDGGPKDGEPEAAVEFLDTSSMGVRDRVDEAGLPESNKNDLAYICYTSGSTGFPKGVQVSHENLAYYVSRAVDMYLSPGMGPTPIQQPMNFDGSVTSLWPPLVAGLAVVPLPSGASTLDLVNFLENNPRVGIVKATPTQFRVMQELLRDKVLLNIEGTFVFGGERLLYSDIARLRGLYPQVRVFNQYGPTETTVASMAHEVLPSDPYSDDVPIGRPIEGTFIKLLHDPEASGPSELLIGGPGVTRGYLNRPEETAARFVEEDVDGVRQRFYRTGDLVQRNIEGRLVFAGRRDHQLKRHGFRIELGEIESLLRNLDNVRDAVVITCNEMIHAFVVTDNTTSKSVATAATAWLPSYMLPDTFTILDTLPITDRGKLDRQALMTRV